MHNNRHKKYIIAFILLIVLIVTVSGALIAFRISSTQQVTNFQQCKDAGYPIMESAPEQCMADTQIFIDSQSDNQ
jgi:hypothetical protein